MADEPTFDPVPDVTYDKEPAPQAEPKVEEPKVSCHSPNAAVSAVRLM